MKGPCLGSFFCVKMERMNEAYVFNRKQNLFVVWCMLHIPSVHFYESKSGMLMDPFTKNYIGGVFYYDSWRLFVPLIDFVISILGDNTSSANEAKCVKYGLLERI